MNHSFLLKIDKTVSISKKNVNFAVNFENRNFAHD